MLKNLMKFHSEFNVSFDYLIDDYLNNCYFIGIMSNHFKNITNNKDFNSLPEMKKYAINYVINHFYKYGKIKNAQIKIGFSDDDNDYINIAKHIFIKNKEILDNINFYVFNTSNPDIKNGIKIKI
jgi:hypothetical protein